MRIMTGLRWRRLRRGQALIEFAIVLPVLLILIFGGIGVVVNVANYVSYDHALTSASRLAAIEWDPIGDPQQVTQDVRQQFRASLDRGLGKPSNTSVHLESFKVWTAPCSPTSSPNSCVFVQAQWPAPQFPFLPQWTFDNTQGYKTEPD